MDDLQVMLDGLEQGGVSQHECVVRCQIAMSERYAPVGSVWKVKKTKTPKTDFERRGRCWVSQIQPDGGLMMFNDRLQQGERRHLSTLLRWWDPILSATRGENDGDSGVADASV